MTTHTQQDVFYTQQNVFYTFKNINTQETKDFLEFEDCFDYVAEKNNLLNCKRNFEFYTTIQDLDKYKVVTNETITPINLFILHNTKTQEERHFFTIPDIHDFLETKENFQDYSLIETKAEENEFLQSYIFNRIKKQKLKELEEVYEKSKTVYVNNGNSFTLSPKDKYYEEFRKRISEACNTTTENKFNKEEFFCIQNGFRYTITLMNYVWRFVFNPTQKNRRDNKKKYDTYLHQIENATSIDKINNLIFDFDFKDGFVVDVNTITTRFMKELKEGKHPEEVAIEMQNFLSSQKDQEHIELVKKEEL